MGIARKSIPPIRIATSVLLTVGLIVFASSCTSRRSDPPESPRDAILYDDFLDAQSVLVLAETGPDGEPLRLRYTAQGDSANPAVVLVHGVPSSSWMYRYVLEHLAADDLYVVAPDNLGYGASDKPQMTVADATTFYAPARQAERLVYLLDALSIDEAIFVVHDVGGPIIWELLGDARSRAAGIVILNTIGAPGGFAPPRAMDNRIVQTGMRLVGFEREQTIRTIVCGMVTVPEMIDTPVQLEGYYRPFREGSELPYYAFLTELDVVRERLPAYTALIESLTVPAALFWGVHDDNLRADPSVDWFARTLNVPEARLVVSEEAKHLVAEEAHERIAALIVSLAADRGI